MTMDKSKLAQAQVEAAEDLVCAHLAELGLEPSHPDAGKWPPFTEAPAVIETQPQPKLVFKLPKPIPIEEAAKVLANEGFDMGMDVDTAPHEPDPAAVADAAKRGDGTGFCVACGHMQRDIGPRERGLHCEACGAHKMCGAEELIIMGYGPSDT